MSKKVDCPVNQDIDKMNSLATNSFTCQTETCKEDEMEKVAVLGEKINEIKLNDFTPNSENSQLINPDLSNQEIENPAITADRTKALALLPEEVWLLIFEKVSDPQDLENISNSSLYFRQLLSSQRVHFLFYNVWRVLAARFQVFASYMANYYGDITDTWFKYTRAEPVNYHNLLKSLRMVSKEWAMAIDTYYESHPYHFANQHRGSYRNSAELNTNRLINHFYFIEVQQQSNHRPKKFLQHFDPSHRNTKRNPFFGRKIYLKFISQENENAENFAKNVLSILSTYGHHVWYAEISMQTTAATIIADYLKFRRVLQLMPNLKVLHIENHTDDEVDSQHADIQAYINAHPLPTLTRLEKLTSFELFSAFLQELLQRNYHIVTLIIDHRRTDELFNMHNVSFPNLNTLKMTFLSELVLDNLAAPLLNSHLNKLSLRFSRYAMEIYIHWQRIFDVLQQSTCAITVTNLKLNLPEFRQEADRIRIRRESPGYVLQLPNVTRLDLTIENLACLDFLLPMKKSLTYLRLYVWGHVDEDELMESVESESESVFKIWSCARSPLNSNIWEKLPKLMHVDLVVSYGGLEDFPDDVCWNMSRAKWLEGMEDSSSEDY